jgi:hypothetical protein
MKFFNLHITSLVIFFILQLCTSQLLEQFHEEPSLYEKGSKSLFEEPEEIKKENNTNEKTIGISSIFGLSDVDTLKPIEKAKPKPKPNPISNQIENKKDINNQVNNPNPIKNLSNQANNDSNHKNYTNPNKPNNTNDNTNSNKEKIFKNESLNIINKGVEKKIQNQKDEIDQRKEILEKIKSKNNEKIKLQKQEIKRLQEKFNEINQKTKNIMKIMKSNSSIEKIKGKYQDDIARIDGYAKDYKNLNKNINKLAKNIESISSELIDIENKKDLKGIKETKKIDLSHKLRVQGNLKTKKLLAEELKLGGNKISNNFIQLDKDFKIVYKNQVNLINTIFKYYKKQIII